MFKTPLHKRLRASERFKDRYRSDPEFRLARINARRVAEGKEPVASLPPVGQVRPAWAATRQRDDKGRFA